MSTPARSIAELTQALFGEPLTLDEADHAASLIDLPPGWAPRARERLWVGSVGYERYKESAVFTGRLRASAVERLIDVRELPISRRRGYAKRELQRALADVGIEYVHLKRLGNPKVFRDLYKSGLVSEGRAGYERHLLTAERAALEGLVPLLREKRSALMCFEHEPRVCHRTVIIHALREELGVELHVAELG